MYEKIVHRSRVVVLLLLPDNSPAAGSDGPEASLQRLDPWGGLCEGLAVASEVLCRIEHDLADVIVVNANDVRPIFGFNVVGGFQIFQLFLEKLLAFGVGLQELG